MVDYLIVGQGVAGTMLFHFLTKKGKKVMMIDNDHASSSSTVAAGIVNPVTGRKYTKSWMIDDLIPFAIETYQELETLLQIPIIAHRNIIRTLPDVRSENNWYARLSQNGYESYLEDDPSLGQFEDMIAPPFGFGEIRQSFQVRLLAFLKTFRKHYSGFIITEEFNYNMLQVNDDNVSYNDLTTKDIIFCEGYKVKDNPYYNYLPFEGAKGEVLILRIPGYQPEKILRHKIFFAPLEEDVYWVGAGYAWDLNNVHPTEKERDRLLDIVDSVLKVPYEVVDHIAGVRPASRDRRPIMGTHPQFNRIHLFNGLGTKGSSLAPFWASRMADFLVDNSPLESEVDLGRFKLI